MAASPARRRLLSVRHAQLRLHKRRSPFQAVLPLARFVVTAGLLLAMVAATVRFITQPPTAGALEFTRRIIAAEDSAVGVQGITGGDIDDDGDIDIVTAGKDGVVMYVNDGEQSFSRLEIDGVDGERIQIADFDEDGADDLLVTLKGAEPSVKWYRNIGDNQFSGTTLGTGRDAKAYAGDINADGAPDIVSATDQGGSILLQRWMNNGSGTFTATTLSADAGVTTVTIGDIDGNGYKDIVTGGSQGLQRWSTGDGLTWTRADIDDDNDNKTHVTVANVIGDAKADIITGDQEEDIVAVYRNQDNSSFQRIALNGSADAKSVRAVDLDENGREDIVVTAQDDNTVYWYENMGNDEFTRRTLATGLQTTYEAAVIDVDLDNDFDFIAADHYRGAIYWYERVRSKPKATSPSDISQTTDGSGRLTFQSTLSDGDRDRTRLRIQYSTDGVNWHKPWLENVTASAGSVDLKNSNGYQVGTTNPIDTDLHDTVTLTFTWDTKSSNNTGGALTGDLGSVRLRLTPRDALGNGDVVTSAAFRVDNRAPQGLTNVRISDITEDEATLVWDRPTDSSSYQYAVHYGTDRVAVLEQRAEVWDTEDDGALVNAESNTTTVTGLEANKTYTFKLTATDDFGNQAAAPSVQGVTTSSGQAAPTPTPGAGEFGPNPTPEPGATATPFPTSPPGGEPGEGVTPAPTPFGQPSPTAAVPPATTVDNRPPVADAGKDQVVNPSALVILDGTASFDLDQDSLVFAWRQIDGPRVELVSERTATPSFSAGNENEVYIFALTTRDPRGASSTDTVTVATRTLPVQQTVPVDVRPQGEATVAEAPQPLIFRIMAPINLLLFALSVLSTSLSLGERLARSWRQKQSVVGGQLRESAKGRVLHYRTGDPIAGARVLVYGSDGKLRSTERANDKGEFPLFLPAGEYTIGVQAEGFTFAPASPGVARPTDGMLYSGGKLTVRDPNTPLQLAIPMKPTGKEISSLKTRFLHAWQTTQYVGRVLSWPIFLVGALMNTVLVFRTPSFMYLFIEVLYVVLVIAKVVLEVRVRPAYGLVRDAITHVPLDLAVVRLYEQGTNRLVMTRVTNSQGKFFALPPASEYTVTVTKPGYAVFSKQNVNISTEQDSALQITSDLMPVAPQGGLAQARAAVI